MQPLQNCIGPTIRIGREIRCLPYAGFLNFILFVDLFNKILMLMVVVLVIFGYPINVKCYKWLFLNNHYTV